eukprot:TRINITY_DN87956_c0_g1_i1.p1 TRINITY_DN87956_c0_g1~~TRINITY_DN87956_c0_g1_i1.p1  ORF type:complete len:187 (+),score=41.83 TRINITY_DN87956_c0_g1_i1:51-611(+)
MAAPSRSPKEGYPPRGSMSQGRRGTASAGSAAPSSSPPPKPGACSFSVSPRPASEPSSARRAASTAAAAVAASVAADSPSGRAAAATAAWSEAPQASFLPGRGSIPPPPGGGGPPVQWRKDLESLQHEYAEALKSIDARLNERLARLKAQLESSRTHELPPSYPPSDASRQETEPEVVETDPECSP